MLSQHDHLNRVLLPLQYEVVGKLMGCWPRPGDGAHLDSKVLWCCTAAGDHCSSPEWSESPR